MLCGDVPFLADDIVLAPYVIAAVDGATHPDLASRLTKRKQPVEEDLFIKGCASEAQFS